MNLETLDKPIAELSTLMGADLRELSAELEAANALLARRKDVLHAVLLRRFETAARDELAKAGKDTGTVTVMTNDGAVKVEFPKKVVWNQQKLTAALNGMTPENARHYAKVTLEVSETKFKAAPPDVQAALLPARTVELGKIKFSFKLDTQEVA